MKTEYIKEIEDIEKEFCICVAKLGVKEAFVRFADENGVINRGNEIHSGKKGIEAYYSTIGIVIIKLEWQPSFIDVSEDGSMAYSYGNYDIAYKDSDGKSCSGNGIFHTVWKRQADGSWKYVYD
jgi:ketosteroid isomerase-like protein